MSKVVYLYDHQWNIRTQIFDVTNFECTQNLNGYDTASFQIPNTHEDNTLLNLRPLNECKITLITENGEKTYIHGVLGIPEAGLQTTTVFVRSFEWLFENKIIDVSKNYLGQTLDAIMADLLWGINARYDMGITLDCGVTDTVDLPIAQGATFASALKDIVALWYQYRVINKKLTVKSSVWSDKSTGVGVVELRRVFDDPLDRNIWDANIKYDGTQIINAPFDKSAWFSTDADSIGSFGRLEKTVWSVQERTTTLEQHKDLIKILEVEPSIDDFFFADIGDQLKLELDAGNDLMQHNWSVHVLQKIIDTRDVVRVQVSTTTTKSLSFLETVKDNAREILKLKNG